MWSSVMPSALLMLVISLTSSCTPPSFASHVSLGHPSSSPALVPNGEILAQVPLHPPWQWPPMSHPPPFTQAPRAKSSALKACAAWIPFDTQCSNVVAIPPWETPLWLCCLTFQGPSVPKLCKKWVDDLYSCLPFSRYTIIDVAVLISSKGHFDNVTFRGAGATLSF